MVCCLSPKRHYWLVLDQYHPEYEHDVFPSTWKKEQSHRVDQNSIREKISVITGLIMGLNTHWSASLSPYLLGLDVESSSHQPRCSIKFITAQIHRGAEADKSCFFLLERSWWALSVETHEVMYSSEMCLFLMGELGSTCSVFHNIFNSECIICVRKKYVNKVTVYHSLNIQMRFDAYEIAKGYCFKTL